MHFNNYTLFELPNQNLSLYAFQAHQLKIGNFTLNSTMIATKSFPTIVDNHFPHLLLQTTDPEAGEFYVGNMSESFSGILFRQYEGMEYSLQAYFPLTDCADVAIEFKDKSLQFTTDGNFLFKMNQGIFKLEGESCVNQLVFIYNASYDLMILGRPLLSNSNISVNYDEGLLGLSNGKDLNPVKINYTPRVIILFVSFSLISLALGLLGKQFSNTQIPVPA